MSIHYIFTVEIIDSAGIKNPETVLGTLTLTELGMDSLMGTDIKQALEQDFNIELSAKEIRELTFNVLKGLTANSEPTGNN